MTFVWTSDWHLGRKTPAQALAVAQYIASLNPAGVIDTGDCKEHYGATTGSETDDYLTSVRDVIPWATSSGTDLPILPGNHDEVEDYFTPGAATDFSIFNGKLWGPPYHWTADWAAPQIRFIAIHSYIHHSTDGLAGFFHVDGAEIQWLSNQLAGLPDGWQAIVCSHAPAAPAFGNEIGRWPGFGGTELRALLAANQPRIAAYLNGHRHANMNTTVLDGITHFNGGAVSYTAGNGYGGFMPIDYDSAARTLTFHYHLAVAPYAAFPGYTQVVIQLPPLEVPPPADSLPLTKVSEDASTITLGWTPVAGVGYRFSSEGQTKKSHTWDANRSTVKFAKGSAYKVEALGVTAEGDYP